MLLIDNLTETKLERMKYFDELTDVETEIIRLGEMNKLYSVISNGAEESSHEQLVSAIQFLEGCMNDIHDRLKNNYQALFDAIREDSVANQ